MSKINYLGKIFSLIGITFFLFLGFLPTPAYATGNVTVTLSPSSGSIGQATQVINVNINTNGTAITVADIYISYDPAILSVTAEQGTITTFMNSGLYVGANEASGLMRIQQGTNSSYTGSGLLAKLNVKVLTAVTALQDTEMTITASSKVTTASDSTTNQLASSVLGATSTFTADPDYTGKNLPGTAIFDDNRILLLAQILIGISLVYLGTRAIKIKARNSEIE